MNVVVIPVTPTGEVHPGFGRAPRVATCTVTDGVISDWTVHAVGWDVLHDEGAEGAHHARMVRFAREHGITDVVTGHMGQGMVNTFGKLGLRIHMDAAGDAQAAVLAVLAR